MVYSTKRFAKHYLINDNITLILATIETII